jgi:hypothetical protein
MNTHPKNKGTNFVNTLAQPLNFSGQTLNETVSWQVALSSIQYTHNFLNYCEASNIYVLVDKPSDNMKRSVLRNQDNFVLDFHSTAQYREENLTLWNFGDRDIDITQRLRSTILKDECQIDEKRSNVKSPKLSLFARFHMPSKHYGNTMELVQDLMRLFNERYMTQWDIKLQASIIKSKLFMSLSNGADFRFFSDSPYLAKCLGLKYSKHTFLVPEGDVYTYRFHHDQRTGTPRLDDMRALYVYSDCVQNQRIGDTSAPLLQVVPIVEGAPGREMYMRYDKPDFLPVSKTNISALEIKIADAFGKPIPFPDDENSVVTVRLIFRDRSSALI